MKNGIQKGGGNASFRGFHLGILLTNTDLDSEPEKEKKE